MPVFLNQERTKIGTTTGTLIAFPQELEVNDPAVGNSAELLPAGYLRCDGGVYSEEIYPALAQVLGTGEECSFRQEGVTLGDNQFQVPDLRSKFIRASSASDQGVINDNTVISATGQTIERSGVGVAVSSNVGSVANVDLIGQFRIPPRTVNLTGNVGFTRPRSPDEEVVTINAFLPHMHYTTTFRCRTIRRQGSDIFEINYYTNASTIGVHNWFDATDSDDGTNARQDACRYYAESEVWLRGDYIPSSTFATYSYSGICKGSCGGFITSCLVPQDRGITVDTRPDGPCTQTYSVFGIGLITVNLEGCGGPSSYFIGPNYISSASGVGVDNIPNSATGSSGVVQSFSLYDVDLDTGSGSYVNKGFGQWAYSQYNPGWSSLTDFGQSEVDMSGGTGSDFRVLVRFEAWPGPGGAPVYTRYKVSSFVDGGQNYSSSDVLTFPDVQGVNISGAPAQGTLPPPNPNIGISMLVNTTGFANFADAAAYSHDQSLHHMLPVDTSVDAAQNVVYPQVSNVIETTLPFNYDSDPTRHTHTINYTTGLTNYQLNIPELFVSTDGLSASINIQPETASKIDNLISPFIMVDYLIKT